jgi:hypothetical protein
MEVNSMENNNNVENNETKAMDPAEIQKNKVKEITDKLETGIKELFDSEKYVTWLNTMSKFHEYSLNNTILIAMQRPDATMVAGYTQWQKDFERNVNKGEKAIRILHGIRTRRRSSATSLIPRPMSLFVMRTVIPSRK